MWLMWHRIFKKTWALNFYLFFVNFNAFRKVNNYDLIINNVLLIVKSVLFSFHTDVIQAKLIDKLLLKFLFWIFQDQISTRHSLKYNSFPSSSAAHSNISLKFTNWPNNQTLTYYNIVHSIEPQNILMCR